MARHRVWMVAALLALLGNSARGDGTTPGSVPMQVPSGYQKTTVTGQVPETRSEPFSVKDHLSMDGTSGPIKKGDLFVVHGTGSRSNRSIVLVYRGEESFPDASGKTYSFFSYHLSSKWMETNTFPPRMHLKLYQAILKGKKANTGESSTQGGAAQENLFLSDPDSGHENVRWRKAGGKPIKWMQTIYGGGKVELYRTGASPGESQPPVLTDALLNARTYKVPGQPVKVVFEQVQVLHHTIHEPTTLGELFKTIQAEEAKGFLARHEILIGVLTGTKDPDGRFLTLTVPVKITITLPFWSKGPGHSDPAVRQEWNRVYESYKWHEYGHLEIAQDQLASSWAVSLLKHTQSEAQPKATARLNQIKTEHQDPYDKATAHGTKGVKKPTGTDSLGTTIQKTIGSSKQP